MNHIVVQSALAHTHLYPPPHDHANKSYSIVLLLIAALLFLCSGVSREQQCHS